jgi:hypothetical protein
MSCCGGVAPEQATSDVGELVLNLGSQTFRFALHFWRPALAEKVFSPVK